MPHLTSSFVMACPIVVSIVLLLVASVHDIAARTIPNWIPLALAFVGLIARAYDGSLMLGVGVAGGVFLVAATVWRCGMMGGGDVKLLGAAALAVPPRHAIEFLVFMSLAGSLLACLYLAVRPMVRRPRYLRTRSLLARAVRAERWRISRGAGLPYACAIAAGGAFVLLQTVS
jgi:prepilin peptidase CpaA